MAKTYVPPDTQEAPRVTAISLNTLELLSPHAAESPSPATSDQIKERLIWALLRGISNTPGINLSLFPVQEIEALVTSEEVRRSFSPLLLGSLGMIFGLDFASSVRVGARPAASAEVSESEEKFCLCHRCQRSTHRNFIYQTASCPCQVCLVCVDQYYYARCPKCWLLYTDSQQEQARALFKYWSGKFEHDSS